MHGLYDIKKMNEPKDGALNTKQRDELLLAVHQFINEQSALYGRDNVVNELKEMVQ